MPPSGDDDGEGGTAADPLAAYAVNLNERARAGEIDPLIGRQTEIERALHVLARRRKNSPLLIGDAGVGKTAIVEGLARRIELGEAPAGADGHDHLRPGHGRAGGRHALPRRLRGALQGGAEGAGGEGEVRRVHRRDAHHRRGGRRLGRGHGRLNLLKPLLSSGRLRCIGTTTHKEYRSYIEKDRALARRFQPIEVGEPSIEDTIKVLRGLRQRYEEFHGVSYTDKSLRAAAELSTRHLADRKLPDKAIDLIDEAGARLKLRTGRRPRQGAGARAQAPIARRRPKGRQRPAPGAGEGHRGGGGHHGAHPAQAGGQSTIGSGCAIWSAS